MEISLRVTLAEKIFAPGKDFELLIQLAPTNEINCRVQQSEHGDKVVMLTFFPKLEGDVVSECIFLVDSKTNAANILEVLPERIRLVGDDSDSHAINRICYSTVDLTVTFLLLCSQILRPLFGGSALVVYGFLPTRGHVFSMLVGAILS
ncbi:hypothetical protein Pelo_15177 [Pelomyxa schiedti]|nr:hypothetical protein Pelo_15177 [Pelomyxa schiedti]